jgi:putative addiction module CopG family antidote
MSQSLPPELERFIEQAIASGQYATREELLADAVRLLREHQLRLDELRLDIQEGYDEIRRGEGIWLKTREELREFFDDIKRRGRERYEAG